MSSDVLDLVRYRAAQVMARARFISIDESALHELATELVEIDPSAPGLDPAHHHLGVRLSTTEVI